jgi:APA family basic amino acid/polyamine antiporter
LSSFPSRALERRLGPIDAAAIVIANVIGVGIFITPGIIATAVPHPMWIIGVWVAGGLLAFAGAVAYAELATLRPRSGGEYVYLREGFGQFAAFLTGWTSFVAGFAGAIAAAALGVGSYLGRFIPAAGDPTPLVAMPLGPLTFVVSRQSLVALTAIIGLAFIHLSGLGPGRLVQNTLAGLKVAALTVFVAAGLSLGHGTMAHLTTAVPATGIGWNGVALAMLLVMFTYSGWNAASYVAEEIRDPGRNVPIALAVGTGVVIVIYLGLNLLYLYALPVGEIVTLASTQSMPIATAAAVVLLGPTAASLIGGLAVVILLSSLSAMTVAGPRVYYAMARDGAFFRSAAKVHPRFHTPWIAIIAQAAWSGVLVLVNWTNPSAPAGYERLDLPSYTGFAVLFFSAFAVSAVFVLRWRYPNEPRPFRAWGYPIAPAVFVLASLAITVFAIAGQQRESLIGLAIMLAGIPLYLVMRWRIGPIKEARSSMSEEPESTPSTGETQGIDGWLALWTINLVLLLPCALYALWAVSIPAAREQPSGWGVGALLYGILFCLFAVLAAVAFFQQRRSAPRLIIALLLANVGHWAIAGTLWDRVVSHLAGHPEVLDFLLWQFVGSLAACFFWIPYFVTSRRVKRTFHR